MTTVVALNKVEIGIFINSSSTFERNVFQKKCEEYVMASDLATDAKELRLNGSTCLHKVYNLSTSDTI